MPSPSKPILQWAEKRAEAFRRAQYIRAAHLDPTTTPSPPSMGAAPVAWRTPPAPMPVAMTVAHSMTGSNSTSQLLQLSFRNKPNRGRPWSAGPPPKRFDYGEGVSEKQLHGELMKTGRILTGAQKQLAEAREIAASKVSEAQEQAAHAVMLAREREGHLAAVEAELDQLLQQKELAVASERAKLANTLAEQRGQLEKEMEYVKNEAEERLERQRATQEAMEQEHRRLVQEVASLKQQLQNSTHAQGNEVELEKKLAEQSAATRAERVEHLRRMAVRRVMQQGLSLGFNTWLEVASDRQRKQQLIRQSGARLCRPKLAGAFHEWKAAWEESNRDITEEQHRAELKAEIRKRRELEQELERVKEEFQLELQTKLHEAMAVAEAARKEAEKKWAEEAARLETEKGRAVRDAKHTLIYDQAMRRMGQQSISKGFNAWKENFLEQRRQRRLVQRASARLSKPALANAFFEWWAVREEAQREKDESEKESLKKQLEELHAQALETEAKAAQKLAEQAGAEREARIEQLHRMAVRRIGLQDLARGFNAWQEVFEEVKRAQFLLQRAGARLSKPRLAGAFIEWWTVREEAIEAQKEKERHAVAQQLELAQAEAQRQEAEVTRQEAEVARQEAEAAQKLAEQAGAEREARIEQLHRMAARRIGMQDLTRGFNAWQEVYEEVKRAQFLLQRAGARLSKPRLAGAFIEWWTVREEAIRAQEHKDHETQLSNQSQQNHALHKELRRTQEAAAKELERVRTQYEETLQSERAKAAKEHAAMKEQLQRLTQSQEVQHERTLAEQADKLRMERIEHLHKMAMRRMSQQGLTRGFNAWLEGHVAFKRSMQLLQRAGARLSKPRLADAFMEWWTVLQEEIEERERLERETRMAQEAHQHALSEKEAESQRTQLMRELDHARAELEEVRKKNEQVAAKSEAVVAKERERLCKEYDERLEQERSTAMKEMEALKLQLEAATHRGDADLAQRLTEQADAAREERIEQLHRMAARRIGKQDLARGFNAWNEMAVARKRAIHLLQRAAARLSKPRLADAFIEWCMVREEALRSVERSSNNGRIISMQEEMAAAREATREAERRAKADAAAELIRVKREYEERLAEEKQEREKAAAELKSVLTGGEEALKEATRRVEGVNVIEEQLRQTKEALQKTEHDLKLQCTAVMDERQAVMDLNVELEHLRKQSSDMQEAEVRAKEATNIAEKSTKEASQMLARLAKQEGELKAGSEKRLADLLAEQRKGFDQTLKAVRLESDHKTTTIGERLKELERQLAGTKAELQMYKERAASMDQKSTMLGTLTALKFAGAAKAENGPRRVVPRTVPRGPISHIDLRLQARKAKEEAEAEVKAEIEAASAAASAVASATGSSTAQPSVASTPARSLSPPGHTPIRVSSPPRSP